MSLTPVGVEHARAATLRYLREQVTVADQVKVRDTTGGTTSTWQSRSQKVAAAFATPQDVEPQAIAGQVGNKAAVVCTLPWGTPIAEGARIGYGTAVDGKARTWTVAAVLTLPTDTATSVRVLLREV